MKIEGIGNSPVQPVQNRRGSTESVQIAQQAPVQESALVVDEVIKPIEEGGVEEAVNTEMMDKAMKQANKTLEFYDKAIERTVHEKTHTVMYILRDTKTNEVIREFPPKKIQDMIAKMWELAGLFVDEKA